MSPYFPTILYHASRLARRYSNIRSSWLGPFAILVHHKYTNQLKFKEWMNELFTRIMSLIFETSGSSLPMISVSLIAKSISLEIMNLYYSSSHENSIRQEQYESLISWLPAKSILEAYGTACPFGIFPMRLLLHLCGILPLSDTASLFVTLLYIPNCVVSFANRF